MKIQRVSILEFSRQLSGRVWNPAFRWTERRAPLLVIEVEGGVRGIGEAWSGYQGIQGILQLLVDEVAPALIGCTINDPSEIEPLLRALRAGADTKDRVSAWSAADMALWDVFGRSHNQPVWRLLGGVASKAPVYASGGLYRDHYSLLELKREAREYRAQGFDGMKMKVCGLSVEEDLQRVAAVREGLGEDAWLWIDGVNKLSVDTARSFWEAVSPYRVSAMQSPLQAHDIDGLSELNQTGLPVIASEAEYRHEVFQELIAKKAVTHLQFCIPLIGGFSGALKLDGWAGSAGITTTPQCFSTAVAQVATLHFAAARSNVVTAEYHCFHDHLKHLYQHGAGTVSGGFASAGAGSGLSIRIPDIGQQPDGSLITCVAKAGR